MSAAKGAGADAGMGAALAYLAELEDHNDRAWFAETKAERAGALAAFDVLVADVQQRVGAFDPAVLGHDPKKLTFKLTRDTRFSNDKSPYNPSLRAHVGPAGKLPVPVGYYLMVRPGGRSFLGGGLFAAMFKDATDRVRRAIAADGDAWERVVEGLAPLQVEGEALKRVRAHEAAERLPQPRARRLRDARTLGADPRLGAAPAGLGRGSAVPGRIRRLGLRAAEAPAIPPPRRTRSPRHAPPTCGRGGRAPCPRTCARRRGGGPA